MNNLIPLNFERWENKGLSKILKEKGKRAVEIEILKLYINGELQQGNNKYNKLLKVIEFVFKEDFFKFDWRNNWEQSKITKKLMNITLF